MIECNQEILEHKMLPEQDLLDLFGLKDKPANIKGTSLTVQSEASSNRTSAGESATVLRLDKWDRDRGKVCLENSPNLQEAKITEDAVADFHGAAFLMEPELAENPSDDNRAKFLNAMMETTEFQSLRSSTVLNDLASELAANQFGQEYAKLVAQQAQDELGKPKGPESPKQKSKREMKAEMAILNAASAALKGAAQDVDDLQECSNAFGGDGGNPNGTTEAQRIAQLFKQIRNDSTLKRICELAGRYRRLAQAKQRMKVSHGFDDMIGIELAGEVQRAIPSELLKLVDPIFEWDALRRLAEKQTMCREYRGIEPLGKGPIIVCVDESGSMQGDKIENAKAFALAMAWIARHQNRWCCLIGYSGGTEGTKLVIPPGKRNDYDLMQWLTHFFGGGTEMDIALSKLPNEWWNEFPQRGKTDMIIIGDSCCAVPPEMERNFREWKLRESVRCISIIIGENTGSLDAVSDEVHRCDAISVTEIGVGQALSV